MPALVTFSCRIMQVRVWACICFSHRIMEWRTNLPFLHRKKNVNRWERHLIWSLFIGRITKCVGLLFKCFCWTFFPCSSWLGPIMETRLSKSVCHGPQCAEGDCGAAFPSSISTVLVQPLHSLRQHKRLCLGRPPRKDSVLSHSEAGLSVTPGPSPSSLPQIDPALDLTLSSSPTLCSCSPPA